MINQNWTTPYESKIYTCTTTQASKAKIWTSAIAAEKEKKKKKELMI